MIGLYSSVLTSEIDYIYHFITTDLVTRDSRVPGFVETPVPQKRPRIGIGKWTKQDESESVHLITKQDEFFI